VTLVSDHAAVDCSFGRLRYARAADDVRRESVAWVAPAEIAKLPLMLATGFRKAFRREALLTAKTRAPPRPPPVNRAATRLGAPRCALR
jgi:hypothetical protein